LEKKIMKISKFKKRVAKRWNWIKFTFEVFLCFLHFRFYLNIIIFITALLLFIVLLNFYSQFFLPPYLSGVAIAPNRCFKKIISTLWTYQG
jgi:hypothetical protein